MWIRSDAAFEPIVPADLFTGRRPSFANAVANTPMKNYWTNFAGS